MRSITSRIVYIIDINTVSTSYAVNVIASILSIKKTREVNQLLRKVNSFSKLLLNSPKISEHKEVRMNTQHLNVHSIAHKISG